MKFVIYTLLVIVVGIIFGCGIYFLRTLSLPAGNDTTEQSFEIKAGQSKKEIAIKLKETNLIRSPLVFSVYVKLTRTKLQAGRYSLNSNMTMIQIATKMSRGEVEQVKVVFPEGWRASQMGDRLEAKELVKALDFIKIAEKEEGYLFPDTYQFPVTATTEMIIKEMKDNFNNRTEELNLTRPQLILASIIEREAKRDTDRKLIAGVFTNRLKHGMRLDADPTVQYAKGSWDEIHLEDYKSVISPYNTYLHAGLPPGPICNPGMKSIQAAINPAKSKYYYFFHTRDGEAVFSKTLDEHRQKIARYY